MRVSPEKTDRKQKMYHLHFFRMINSPRPPATALKPRLNSDAVRLLSDLSRIPNVIVWYLLKLPSLIVLSAS